jgi:formate hydrogenlyase subunit 6/NADH:ubiquinone oxidoreductase subunit I
MNRVLVLPDFNLPPISGEAIASNTVVRDMMHAKIQLLPKADPLLCIACQACIEQCPASALYMTEDIPEVHSDTCITCFCRQEICPEKTMTLQ